MNHNSVAEPKLPAWPYIAVLVISSIIIGLLTNLIVSVLPLDRPWILVAGLFVALAVWTSYRRPIALMIIVLGYDLILGQIPQAELALFGFNRILFYAMMLSPLMLALFWRASRSDSFRVILKADLFIIIFLIANAVSVVTADATQTAFSGFAYLVASISVIYLVRLVANRTVHIKHIVSFLIVPLVAEALLATFQYMTGVGLQFVSSGGAGQLISRAGGTLGNSLGGYLSVGFVFAFNYLLWAKRWHQLVFSGLITGIIVIGILFANTRGTWIDCAFLSILSILLAIRRKTIVVAILVVSILLLTISFALPVGNQLGTRFDSILNEIQSSDSSSFSFRLTLWTAAIRMFSSHPLTGIGVGNYYDALPNYLSPEEIRAIGLRSDSSYNTHNVGFESLAETGLLGTASFVLMLFTIWRLARKGWLARDSVGAGISAALFVYATISPLSMFYGGYMRAGSFYFVVIGLIMASAYLRSTQRSSQSSNLPVADQSSPSLLP